MVSQKNRRFLAIGLMCLSFANVFGSSPFFQSQHINKTQETLSQAYNKGFNDFNAAYNIKALTPDGKDSSFVNFNMEGQCEVTLYVNKNGVIQHGSIASRFNSEELKEITFATTKFEKEIFNEYVTLHELSHCDFANIDNPFLVKDNPELQKEVNYYYRGLGDMDYGDGIKHEGLERVLNENFADSYSFIQLIKKYENNESKMSSLLGVLSKTQALRHEAYLNLQHQRGMESHSTHNALAELLKPEIQEKIKQTNDPIQLKQLALEIANEATTNVYRNQKDDMYSLQQPSVIQGVMYYLRSKTVLQAYENGSETPYHLELDKPIDKYNTENSLIKELGDKYIEQYGLSSQLPEDTWTKINDIAQTNAKGKTISYIDSFYQFQEKYVTYIETNYATNEFDAVNVTTPKEVVQERITKVKENFEQSFQLSNKNTVLNNIKMLRKEVFSKEQNFKIS